VEEILKVAHSTGSGSLNEVAFVQGLGNLIDVYLTSSAANEHGDLLTEAKVQVERAKGKVLEYYNGLEKLDMKEEGLSDADRDNSDVKALQELGVFFVLEYTLQVLLEWTRISDADKHKLLDEGLHVEAGNLPGFWSVFAQMRRELSFGLFDEVLRNTCLSAFYVFEEACHDRHLSSFGEALKALNVELLKAFDEKGLKEFNAVVYKPFGSGVAIGEVVKAVEAISVEGQTGKADSFLL
jgi:hypothetical protein